MRNATARGGAMVGAGALAISGDGHRTALVAVLASVVAVWVLVVAAACARLLFERDLARHAAMERLVATVTTAVVALLTLTPPDRPARPRGNATGRGG